jgi:hypothetical protein
VVKNKIFSGSTGRRICRYLEISIKARVKINSGIKALAKSFLDGIIVTATETVK